jgi:hybrid cluster-associated redox disulfide protein
MTPEAAGPVCAEMLVQEVLLRYPPTLSVFRRYGFPCPACMASVYENVSQVAIMLDVDLASLLADLNAAAAAPGSTAARLPFGREPSTN